MNTLDWCGVGCLVFVFLFCLYLRHVSRLADSERTRLKNEAFYHKQVSRLQSEIAELKKSYSELAELVSDHDILILGLTLAHSNKESNDVKKK